MVRSRAYQDQETPPPAGPAGPAERRDPYPEGLISFPAGCLVTFGGLMVMLLVAGLVALIIVFPGYRDSGTYREALATANLDERVQAALGGALEETGLISVRSEFLTEEEGIRRRIALRVAGPEGNATLYAVGHETQDRVHLESLRLILSNGRRVVVRGRTDSGTNPPPRR